MNKPLASLVALKLTSNEYAWAPPWNSLVTRVFEQLAGKTVWRDQLLWLGVLPSVSAGLSAVKELIATVDLPMAGWVIVDPTVADVLSKPELESGRRIKSRHGRQVVRLSEKVMSKDELEPGRISLTFSKKFDFSALASTEALRANVELASETNFTVLTPAPLVDVYGQAWQIPASAPSRLGGYLGGRKLTINLDRRGLELPKDEDPTNADEEREVNVWIEERPKGFGEPLALGERVTIALNVGRPRPGRVHSGEETKVRDVPAGGLITQWVLASEELEFQPVDGKSKVVFSVANGVWIATFSLLIPETGDSDMEKLGVIPRNTNASMRVTIFSGANVYRTFVVRIPVDTSSADTATRLLTRDDDHVASRLADVGRTGFPPWVSREPTLTVTVATPQLAIETVNTGSKVGSFPRKWPAATGELASDIEQVRLAADAFRDLYSGSYLDVVDPDEMLKRLPSWEPVRQWSNLQTKEGAEHTARWNEVASSKELRDLAFFGNKLYNSIFADEELRTDVDSLKPGQFLYVIWNDSPIDHVPWNLMYREPPPSTGPIDASQFLGLRLRIRYDARPLKDGSTALGAPGQTYRGFAMYWDQDEIGDEAQWQKTHWLTTDRHIFRPMQIQTPRDEIVEWFASPGPRPIPFLYLYCETYKDPQDRVSLRFGGGKQNLISESELGSAEFIDHPLVFANACATTGGAPILTNRVTKVFFDRKCRAYIGTESKVPAVFASRFAHVFLHLFERRYEGRPMSAGEALAQSRLFFWTQYRNLGGLYYCILNQYNAALATSEELSLEAS